VDTFTPTLVDGYAGERTPQTIVHPILNRADPDITIRPAALRTGTLRMLFSEVGSGGGLVLDEDGYIVEAPMIAYDAEVVSLECSDAHAAGGVFSLVSSERGTIEMSYVATGSISRTLDDESRAMWMLEIGYQEVAP
jgi:hypothetical protein